MKSFLQKKTIASRKIKFEKKTWIYQYRNDCISNFSILVHQIAGNNEQDGNQSLPGSSHSTVHHQASHGTNGTGGEMSKCHSYPLIIAR